ncbi:MAG: hypothetical protein JST42_03160, partial [Bacteroidetes bacterium]|nr:hypothetical protein [Bacteroidota bacterium]
MTDEHGGFFIAYITTPGNYRDCYAYCYKDEGGTLKSYGGGQIDQYGKELVSTTACGAMYEVSSAYDAAVQAFMLYPNQQGGCNVVMSIATNAQEMWMGYNRLVRVKKDCRAVTRRRGPNSDDPTASYLDTTVYSKDQVVILYKLKTYNYQTSCHPLNHPDDIVTYTNTRIENNGYGWEPLNISGPKYAVNLPQGVILPTGGNINAEIISSYERELVGNNTLSDYHIHAYYHLNEIYDSIPYELCTDLDHPYLAYRPTLPDNAIPTDTLLGGPDSLIFHALGSQDAYTMNGSGNKVWVTTRGFELGGGTSVYLQELKLVSAGTKKYKFAVNSSDKAGLKIGQEISTGFSGTDVAYNTPSVATDSNGNGLFYVNESGRFARVSPITDGGVLSWGAMGKPIGSGYWAGRPLDNENPMAVLSANGTAVVAWETDRQTGSSDGYNIWMERVSDVFTPAYLPP